MKISDIIDGLEEIQNSTPHHERGNAAYLSELDVERVCALAIELAKHVDELEASLRTHIDFGSHRSN